MVGAVRSSAVSREDEGDSDTDEEARLLLITLKTQIKMA